VPKTAVRNDGPAPYRKPVASRRVSHSGGQTLFVLTLSLTTRTQVGSECLNGHRYSLRYIVSFRARLRPLFDRRGYDECDRALNGFAGPGADA